MKSIRINAPYFDGARLLIAADCTAYAYGAFHRDFIAGRVTLIGCPKLDEGSYTDKLAAIIAANDITSVTVAVSRPAKTDRTASFSASASAGA